jgi:hypothetical protein
LSILGNGTSNIYIILSCDSDIINEINITEVTNGTKLININLTENVKVHKNTIEILRLIKLFDYNSKLNTIIKNNNRNEIKEFMKCNLEENFNLEFNFLDSYNSDELEEDIKLNIDNRITSLYVNLLNYLTKIRSYYSIKRSLNNLHNDDNVPNGLFREYTEFNHNLSSGEYTEIENVQSVLCPRSIKRNNRVLFAPSDDKW